MEGSKPEYWTTSEAASFAGVTPRTVRRWIEHGYLAAHESSDGWLVPTSGVIPAREIARANGHRGRLARSEIQSTNRGVQLDPSRTGADLTSHSIVLLRDQLLTPLLDVHQRLIDRVSQQAVEIGRLEAERDLLIARLHEFEATEQLRDSALRSTRTRPWRRSSAANPE